VGTSLCEHGEQPELVAGERDWDVTDSPLMRDLQYCPGSLVPGQL